jgi:hypothetical protein
MALSYDDQLVVINISLVFFLEPPSCSCSYYLFACIAFCYQRDVSLHVHVLHVVGLVVLRLNDV